MRTIIPFAAAALLMPAVALAQTTSGQSMPMPMGQTGATSGDAATAPGAPKKSRKAKRGKHAAPMAAPSMTPDSTTVPDTMSAPAAPGTNMGTQDPNMTPASPTGTTAAGTSSTGTAPTTPN